MTLLRLTDRGLYCAAGDFHVDPWAAVDRAVVTHAHGDHLAWGCHSYLTSADGVGVAQQRLGGEANVRGLEYGEAIDVNGVRVSLHPAGHILGSAQVRLEHRGEVWVVSGDYKTDPDPTCRAFEPVRCHTFVTESTIGLPIYRWPPQAEVLHDVNLWWWANQQAGRTTLLYGYALGGATALAGLDPPSVHFTHGAVERMNAALRG
jgi:putative mRNA 3-end processing factor